MYDTVESCRSVDIRKLRKAGSLVPGSRGTLSWTCDGAPAGSISYHVEEHALILTYQSRHVEVWKDCTETLDFAYTDGTYGGERIFVQCPVCWKRLDLVYATGDRYLCRKCSKLNYACQQESELYRPISRLQKIRKRLGGDSNIHSTVPPRPKHMNQVTYERITEEYALAKEAYQSQLRLLIDS
jgi:hypothetical protein